MKVKLINWWQRCRKRTVITAIIVLLAIGLIVVGYQIDVFGFNGYHTVTTATAHSGTSPATITRTEVEVPAKSFWDWLQLLIIPAVLAVGGYAFNFTVSRNEQRIASDNQRETELQGYIDKISELLLNNHLAELNSII